VDGIRGLRFCLVLVTDLWVERCNCLRRALITAADGKGDLADCIDGTVCRTVPRAGFAAAQDDKVFF